MYRASVREGEVEGEGAGDQKVCPCCGQELGVAERLRRLRRSIDWLLFLASGALLVWTLQSYL